MKQEGCKCANKPVTSEELEVALWCPLSHPLTDRVRAISLLTPLKRNFYLLHRYFALFPLLLFLEVHWWSVPESNSILQDYKETKGNSEEKAL
jgi:hypothetical protein